MGRPATRVERGQHPWPRPLRIRTRIQRHAATPRPEAAIVRRASAQPFARQEQQRAPRRRPARRGDDAHNRSPNVHEGRRGGFLVILTVARDVQRRRLRLRRRARPKPHAAHAACVCAHAARRRKADAPRGMRCPSWDGRAPQQSMPMVQDAQAGACVAAVRAKVVCEDHRHVRVNAARARARRRSVGATAR